MPDNSRSQLAKSAHTMTPQDASQPPLAEDQLFKTVSDLNIARKNRLIYPGDHANVQRSLLQAHQSIGTVLDRIGRLTLSTSNETLLVANQRLDIRNKVPNEMANVLKKLSIAALTFDQGLPQEELGDLIGVLVHDPNDILENGGISEWVKPPEFSHTHVFPLDYSQLEITEEEEITRDKTSDKTSGKASVWDCFVNQLFIDVGSDKDGEQGFLMDPISLAGMLNQNKIDPAKAVESYRQLLKSQFATKTKESGPADQPEDSGIVYFSNLLQELHPNVREQFLSVTFDHCTAHNNDPAAMKLLDGLGQEMAIQMMRYAKVDGKNISPSLMALIQKIGHLPLSGQPNPASAMGSDEVSSIEVGALLRSEDYDHFIDQDYSAMLKELAGRQSQVEPIEALAGDLEQGLDPKAMNAHIGKVLTRLMVGSRDSQSYRDWARHLIRTMDDLVDDGAFTCLSDIFVFVSKEDEFQKDLEKKRIAGFILQHFSKPRFIAHVINRISDATKASVSEAAVLLHHIGTPALIEILDSMGSKDNDEHVGAKLDLLTPFGRRAAEEAGQRLHDPRPAYLCLMARVICRFGDADMAEGMRYLISHEHRDVRLEVLGALLKHKNGWGLVRLRFLIKAEWSGETEQALELVGRYKVREVMPLLISTLQRWFVMPVQFELVMAIITALGHIGDPQAVPALNKLVHRRWSLAIGRLRQLQRSVFFSLSGYPFSSVVDLVHFGLNHKDQSIRTQCAELLKKYHSRTSGANPEREKKA